MILPWVGNYSVAKSAAFIVVFFVVVTLISFYFASDIFKKSFEIRRLNKRVKTLEKQLSMITEDEAPKIQNDLDIAVSKNE